MESKSFKPEDQSDICVEEAREQALRWVDGHDRGADDCDSDHPDVDVGDGDDEVSGQCMAEVADDAP